MRTPVFFWRFLRSLSAGIHPLTLVAAVLFSAVPVGGTPAAGGRSAERGPGPGAAR